jgi:hypothetical protein
MEKTETKVEGRRMYPDAGLVEPKGEFRNVAFEIIRENFRKIR